MPLSVGRERAVRGGEVIFPGAFRPPGVYAGVLHPGRGGRKATPFGIERYEDEGHGLAKPKNWLNAYPTMAAFLDKYLK